VALFRRWPFGLRPDLTGPGHAPDLPRSSPRLRAVSAVRPTASVATR